jgi:hypothetical protein
MGLLSVSWVIRLILKPVSRTSSALKTSTAAWVPERAPSQSIGDILPSIVQGATEVYSDIPTFDGSRSSLNRYLYLILKPVSRTSSALKTSTAAWVPERAPSQSSALGSFWVSSLVRLVMLRRTPAKSAFRIGFNEPNALAIIARYLTSEAASTAIAPLGSLFASFDRRCAYSRAVILPPGFQFLLPNG